MAMKGGSISLLRDVADAVEQLGEARVRFVLKEAIAGTSAGRSIAKPSESKKGATGPRSIVVRQALVEQSYMDLKSAESRESGLFAIKKSNLTRRELEALARLIDVPVRKDQRVEDLEDLIVNVTVGSRLNSRAIRYGA